MARELKYRYYNPKKNISSDFYTLSIQIKIFRIETFISTIKQNKN